MDIVFGLKKYSQRREAAQSAAPAATASHIDSAKSVKSDDDDLSLFQQPTQFSNNFIQGNNDDVPVANVLNEILHCWESGVAKIKNGIEDLVQAILDVTSRDQVCTYLFGMVVSNSIVDFFPGIRGNHK